MRIKILYWVFIYLCISPWSLAEDKKTYRVHLPVGITHNGEDFYEFEISSKILGLEGVLSRTEAGLSCNTKECQARRAAKNMRKLRCLEFINSEVCKNIPKEEMRDCEEELSPEILYKCPVGIFQDVVGFLVAVWNVIWNPIDSVTTFGKYISGQVGSGLNYLGVETRKTAETKSISKTHAFGLVTGGLFDKFLKSVHNSLSNNLLGFDCYNPTKKLTEVCRFTGDILVGAKGFQIAGDKISISRVRERKREHERRIERKRERLEEMKSERQKKIREAQGKMLDEALKKYPLTSSSFAKIDKEIKKLRSKIKGPEKLKIFDQEVNERFELFVRNFEHELFRIPDTDSSTFSALSMMKRVNEEVESARSEIRKLKGEKAVEDFNKIIESNFFVGSFSRKIADSLFKVHNIDYSAPIDVSLLKKINKEVRSTRSEIIKLRGKEEMTYFDKQVQANLAKFITPEKLDNMEEFYKRINNLGLEITNDWKLSGDNPFKKGIKNIYFNREIFKEDFDNMLLAGKDLWVLDLYKKYFKELEYDLAREVKNQKDREKMLEVFQSAFKDQIPDAFKTGRGSVYPEKEIKEILLKEVKPD